MIVKYKEIYKKEISTRFSSLPSGLSFSHFKTETDDQIFCCKELSYAKPYLEFRLVSDGSSKDVIFIGSRDVYDDVEEYHINFCPFCGEKFVFEFAGKFEQTIQRVARETFDNKIELKKIE